MALWWREYLFTTYLLLFLFFSFHLISTHATELCRLTSPLPLSVFHKINDKEVMKINFNAQLASVFKISQYFPLLKPSTVLWIQFHTLTWLLSCQNERRKNFNCYRVNDGILFSHLSSNFCAQLCMWCVCVCVYVTDVTPTYNFIFLCNNNKCM